MDERIQELENKIARIRSGYERVVSQLEDFSKTTSKSSIKPDVKEAIVSTIDLVIRDINLAIGKEFAEEEWTAEDRIKRC